MTEPSAHYELQESPGREPDQDEQDWLRAQQERHEQRNRLASRTPAGSAGGYPWIA
jgi:hypothetical protein